MAPRKKLLARLGGLVSGMADLRCSSIQYCIEWQCASLPTMSRQRTRPTRDETREKLFEAAAEVFEQQGIGAASIEAIASAAGMTRGAFYSNFGSKDDLIIAMFEDHVERSLQHHRELLARHREPADFIAALRTAERSRHDPL